MVCVHGICVGCGCSMQMCAQNSGKSERVCGFDPDVAVLRVCGVVVLFVVSGVVWFWWCLMWSVI